MITRNLVENAVMKIEFFDDRASAAAYAAKRRARGFKVSMQEIATGFKVKG